MRALITVKRGTKGLNVRPRCIGTAWSLPSGAILFYSNPLHGIPTTPFTTYHVTQGTDPRDSEVRTRGWVYGGKIKIACAERVIAACYIVGSSKIVQSALGINWDVLTEPQGLATCHAAGTVMTD
jgi:hypothetical protein